MAEFPDAFAPEAQELTQLAYNTIAHCVGCFLELHGLLERDAENSYLASEAVDDDPMNQLLGHSITYRIAVGPQAGRKVFTLQTLTACDPEDGFGNTPGNVAGFSLHAGVAPRADERKLQPWAWPESDVQMGGFCRQPGEVRRDFAVVAGRIPCWRSWITVDQNEKGYLCFLYPKQKGGLCQKSRSRISHCPGMNLKI